MLDLIARAVTDSRFFPTVLVVLSAASAVRYALIGIDEWRKVVYWLAAAALTAVVTW